MRARRTSALALQRSAALNEQRNTIRCRTPALLLHARRLLLRKRATAAVRTRNNSARTPAA